MIELIPADLKGIPEMLEEIDVDLASESVIVLHKMGEEIVKRLQSHTSELRPPARRGGADRFAHPGHWADVTGTLARSYRYEVRQSRKLPLQLAVINDDSGGYGAVLEMREGFFVLRGIDDPGGLMDQVFREVVAKYTDWKVRDA